MLYILVLFGSFFGICAILGMRIALKNRNVAKFVRGVSQRTAKAQARGLTMKETVVEKPIRNPRSSALNMQKVRSFLREAEKTMTRRDYDETEQILIKALTVDPDCIEARAELGKLYLVTERDAKAEALYRELLQVSNDVSFHGNLGLACYKQHKFVEACAAYQDAVLLDPRSPERLASLGRACLAARRYSDAAECFEKATERLARDTELLHLLGQCYERLGDLPAAKDAYQRIHRLQPYDEAVKEKLAALSSV